MNYQDTNVAAAMMFQNIPDEMKSYKQFVCWRAETVNDRLTKVPYCPQTGRRASVVDPATWSSFEVAVEASKGYNGIGFVFSEYDPYFGIDLDDPNGDANIQAVQYKIYEQFDTYAELSPSGRGLHIIGKGHIQSGKHPHGIGLFCKERYFTMTGNVYRNAPIRHCQALVETLWKEMGANAEAIVQFAGIEQRMSDQEIYDIACQAANGEKFETLWRGEWEQLGYPSQSEADFALINIISFYSNNREQIKRMFRDSNAGRREKASRPHYVDKMITKSFDRNVPPVEIEQIKHVDVATLPTSEQPMINGHQSADTFMPKQQYNFPGLLKEVYDFYYNSAPKPIEEVALAGAIGTLAGIIGRAYNVSGTGLNQYILIVAQTGRGKEAASGGRSKLFTACRSTVPSIAEFIGPAEIASGPALLRKLEEYPCFCSILGEFGLRLKEMANSNANLNQVMLRRVLLDIYNKSGRTDILFGSNYSDKTKNIKDIRSPCVTIIGETTPDHLYENFEEGLITEGLIPRFLIFEYTGPVVHLNKYFHAVEPSKTLVEGISELAAHCLALKNRGETVNVKLNNEADRMMDDFVLYCESRQEAATSTFLGDLWSRAHVKAMKLAATVSVGINYKNPVIDTHSLNWSIQIICRDIGALTARFQRGEVGKTSDAQCNQLFAKYIIKYLSKPWTELSRVCIEKNSEIAHSKQLITYGYLSRSLGNYPAFKDAPGRSTVALKRTIDHFKAQGIVVPSVKPSGVGTNVFTVLDIEAIRKLL